MVFESLSRRTCCSASLLSNFAWGSKGETLLFAWDFSVLQANGESGSGISLVTSRVLSQVMKKRCKQHRWARISTSSQARPACQWISIFANWHSTQARRRPHLVRTDTRLLIVQVVIRFPSAPGGFPCLVARKQGWQPWSFALHLSYSWWY